jgi:beta-lactam-binding protein with PASTA domain
LNRVFAITIANETARLDSEGKGEVAFTVTNTTARPIRGQHRVKPLDSTNADWLSVAGETERDFSPNATHQVAVKISVPAGTPAGKYSFRLDAVSTNNPDEDYTEGPTVAIEVQASKKPPPQIPWWIVIVAAIVVVVGGVAAWVLLRPRMVDVPNVLTKTITEAQSIAAGRGFNVVVERKEDRNATDEHVIAQDPSEGQAREGSDLKLTVSAPAPPVKLERYKDRNVSEVRPLLEGKYLIVNIQNREDESKPQGVILDQQPSEGTTLKVGQSVTLTIAVPLTPFPMPQVANVGKLVQTAKSELEAKGLKVSVNEVVNPSVPHEQVLEQAPAPNAMVKSGDAVQLKYAITLIQVPVIISGIPWRSADQALKNVGFTLAEVRGDCTNVLSTNPPVGTLAPKGMGVTIYTLGDPNRVCYRPLLVRFGASSYLNYMKFK